MIKRTVLILCFFMVAIVAYLLWPAISPWLHRSSSLQAHSDVPIISDIGWWPYQKDLVISSFSAKAIEPKLGLFNNRFVMEYHIQGTIRGKNGWSPRIKEVQITARLASNPGDWEAKLGDLLLVPVVDVQRDAKYLGETISFNLKLEQITQTMGWGDNLYKMRCGELTETVKVEQPK
ncbi:MAG: hypothetical protein WBN92_05625 [Terriglobia bacterium]